MEDKKVFIISNERVSENLNNYFCDNLDLKSIPEGLSHLFNITLIARKSKILRNHSIKNINIRLAKNIFSFIYEIIQTLKEKKRAKYFVISITPYTFIACIVFFLFKVKPIVYLRSDGYEEYKSIFGLLGVFSYHLMFTITYYISNFISCRKHILKEKNGDVVSPSHLTDKWLNNHAKVNLEKKSLLYVGRIRIEKGIFSFLELFQNLKDKDVKLNIVSTKIDHKKIKQNRNVNLIDTQQEDNLINLYDTSSIFILPSFTEGHPQVLDEALSRLRPVIVFEEINHVTRERHGVFVCRRNANDLDKTIHYIFNNYFEIQSKIRTNKLPTKATFLDELKLTLQKDNMERWPSG